MRLSRVLSTLCLSALALSLLGARAEKPARARREVSREVKAEEPPTPASEAPPPSLTPSHPVSSKLRCAACHTEEGFFQPHVRFDHDKTGFVLSGAHVRAPCRACHASGDWERPVPAACVGCHRDPHAGELGLRCEGCHDDGSWRTTFTVDAHRRTAFPLSGRHALIPCQECHPNARDRSFAGAAAACASCHAADAARASLRTVDHVASGFSPTCRTCHQVWSFSPARFPAHDLCFEISRGVHGAIRCADCHAETAGLVANGACATGNATCTGCHVHECGKTDPLHAGVPGYSCSDRRCLACHRIAAPR